MSDDEQDDEKDQDLAARLRLWKTPQAPEHLEHRLRASFRAAGSGGSFWKQLRGSRVSLPLPLAALVAAALLAIGALAGQQSTRSLPARGQPQRSEGSGRAGLANLRPLPEIRVTVLKQSGGVDDPR